MPSPPLSSFFPRMAHGLRSHDMHNIRYTPHLVTCRRRTHNLKSSRGRDAWKHLTTWENQKRKSVRCMANMQTTQIMWSTPDKSNRLDRSNILSRLNTLSSSKMSDKSNTPDRSICNVNQVSLMDAHAWQIKRGLSW